MKFFKNNYYRINELANQCRREWNINENDAIDIFSLALNKIDNLTIVFIKMNKELSGACYSVEGENIIFINSTHSKGRQAFTLAHEIYHLREENSNFSICSVSNDDDIEKEADQFASCLLMPHSALESYKLNNNILEWNLDNIIKAEQYFQISHQAMIWRIRSLENISYDEYIGFKNISIKQEASVRGYDLKLYEPYISKDNFTIGNYINLAEKAFNNDLISIGKKEELLLDAYRSDIVYNL